MTKLICIPEYEAILRDYSTSLYLLIRVQGPSKPEDFKERPRLNLSLVIDRSGSMSGQPLREAKKCAKMIVTSLTPRDRASIIAYDGTVSVLHETTEVKNPQTFLTAINGIQTAGMTNLHGGWEAGAKSLPTSQQEISRVLLLSDGQANRGITGVQHLQKLTSIFADKGITTSTYGLGTDFNEELMIAMADSGGGNSYYGETAEDLMDPFQEEFDLLSALYGKNLRMQVSTQTGYKASVCNLYRQDKEQRYCLPNLPYEAEVWALIKVEIPKKRSKQESITLGEIVISFEDFDGKTHQIKSEPITMPTLPAAAFSQLTADETVQARKQEIEAAQLQDKARLAALNRDWVALDALLEEAQRNAQNNAWLKAVVNELQKMAKGRQEREITKELSYSTARIRSRKTALNESASNTDAEASFLRRKIRQGKKE